MLKAFGRMGYFSLQRHFGKKESLGLFNFPDSEFSVFVDILLIKKRHLIIYNYSLQIYDLFAKQCRMILRGNGLYGED